MEVHTSTGLDREAKLISWGRHRIIKSTPGTSVVLRAYYCRSLFNSLKEKWLNETINYSSTDDIFSHPSYLKIVQMGPAFITYILQELDNAPYYWFDALATITQHNPISEEHMNDVDAMVGDWKNWAELNGY